ncbi:MAG: hypothetical protein WAN01_08795, partial [Bradyrhizobium sp.]
MAQSNDRVREHFCCQKRDDGVPSQIPFSALPDRFATKHAVGSGRCERQSSEERALTPNYSLLAAWLHLNLRADTFSWTISRVHVSSRHIVRCASPNRKAPRRDHRLPSSKRDVSILQYIARGLMWFSVAKPKPDNAYVLIGP